MHRILSIFLLFTLVTLVPQKAISNEIEVLHMWKTEAELRALSTIKDPIIERGIKWNDYWVKGNFQGVQSEFARRISIDDQPTVIQWILTGDMEKLVLQNTIRKLDNENGRFSQLYHPEVYELVDIEGGISALPIGIHTQNHIVYNRELLDKFDLSIAETWEELISFGPILKENGIDLIATSDADWQVRNLGMSVLSGYLDYDEFTTFQTQGHDIKHLKRKISEALNILEKLREFTNTDNQNLDWEDVSKKVANGESLTQVLGDYIIPEFPDRSLIACGVTPQSKYILWGVDSFIFPVSNDPNIEKAQDIFIDVATNPNTIQNYVDLKGGIPVTTNVPPENLDICSGNILRNWNQSDRKLWMGGEAWAKRLGILGLFLSQKWKIGFGDIDTSTEELIMLMHSID